MRKALLIGFEYEGSLYLPGITIDLYLAYKFLKDNGWKDEEIEILSDIKKDHPTEVLKRSILEKVVNSDILSFIADCKEKNIYITYNDYNHYNNFYITLNKDRLSNLFIYYSGHAKDGHLVLPNNALCSISNFKDAICRKNKYVHLLNEQQKNVEIFLIMDCCQCDIELPFILVDGVYRFENENFVYPAVISISSSLSDQNSFASKIGSLFSRHVFDILNIHKNKDITFILKEINKTIIELTTKSNAKIKLNKLEKLNSAGKQTSIVSASIPIHHVFGWIYSFPAISISSHPLYLEVNL